jgi:hypothetical protein
MQARRLAGVDLDLITGLGVAIAGAGLTALAAWGPASVPGGPIVGSR